MSKETSLSEQMQDEWDGACFRPVDVREAVLRLKKLSDGYPNLDKMIDEIFGEKLSK